MSQIFGFQKNTPGRANAGQNVVIAEVLDIKPPATPTFEEARKQLEERFRQERANQMLTQRVAELADKAKASSDLKKAAKELGLTVKSSDLVGPTGQVPDIGPIAQAAPMIFDMKKGAISDPVRAMGGGAVIQLVDRQEPTPAQFAEQKDQIRDQLAAQKRTEAINEFARNVREKMIKDGTIKINKQEEQRLMGASS
jgi:peptidyl-prolyl cis-trans isomerase D